LSGMGRIPADPRITAYVLVAASSDMNAWLRGL
jgi:hypothetical protein